ncbi:MAG: hypothetical protein ACLU3F_15750 [Blautia wexlerae]
MNQLFAAYSARQGRQGARRPFWARRPFRDTDKLYAKFAEEFEQRYVSRATRTNRTIEETLDIGWELLSILPETELKRIKRRVHRQVPAQKAGVRRCGSWPVKRSIRPGWSLRGSRAGSAPPCAATGCSRTSATS